MTRWLQMCQTTCQHQPSAHHGAVGKEDPFGKLSALGRGVRSPQGLRQVQEHSPALKQGDVPVLQCRELAKGVDGHKPLAFVLLGGQVDNTSLKWGSQLVEVPAGGIGH